MHSFYSHQWIRTITLLTALFLIPLGALADDVTSSIEEALKYYENGEYTEAASTLTYASQLIQQSRAQALGEVLPEPLDTWEAKKIKTQANPSLGVTAERKYIKDNAQISIQIMVDSPMLQGVMMMFTNPMYATSSGGKMEKINNHKSIITYDADKERGDIKFVIDNRYYVAVEGRKLSEEDLRAYAQAINFEKFKTLK